MYLPNKLTIIRLIFIPFLLLFLLCDNIKNNYLYALLIFIAASFTDYLDGKIARKCGLITTFGKFADPLADKILVISAYICFVQLNLINAIPVIIIISREFIVTSIRLMASNKGKVISANFWGKSKTVSQIMSIALIITVECINDIYSIYNIDFYKYTNIYYIINISVWISVIFTIISGIIYIVENKKFIEQLK